MDNKVDTKEADTDAKMNQIVILLAEKQDHYRNLADKSDKQILQAEIDGLQSDLNYLENKNKEERETEREKRMKQMDIIQLEARDLFHKKNNDYGDAFATYGPVGVIVRIGDKISRLQSISKKGITLIEDEKIRDTLIDLHNYAAMAIMLLDETSP